MRLERLIQLLNMLPVLPLHTTTPKGCFRACLKMALAYYGDDVTDEEIDNFLITGKNQGSYLTELARFAASKGFKAKCFAYNLLFTDPSDGNKTQKQLLEKLNETKLNKEDENYSTMLKSTIMSLKSGVVYKILKPSKQIITRYISNKIPLILSVNYAALHNKQGNPFKGHNIILIDIDQDLVSYIDPAHGFVETSTWKDLKFGILQKGIISASAYMLAIWK